MGIARQALLWASRRAWIGEQFKRWAFSRRAVAKFIPGESVEAALNAAEAFEKEGRTSLVTQLGENVATSDEAANVREHYLAVLDEIRARDLACQLSLKPTQLGLDLGLDVCSQNLLALLKQAADAESFIWVDMESSAYVERTLELFEVCRARYDNVGVCVQSYLYRTADDIESLIDQKAAVRLVKGAYSEPPEVAFPTKKDVDASFLQIGKRLLDARTSGESGVPVFGTHDRQLLRDLFDYAAEQGLDRREYEIQMLYGISNEYQRELAEAGHRMRVLISYGSAWFPWYMRRLAERPANVLFVLRSIFSK